MYNCCSLRSSVTIWLIVLSFLLSGCAAAPIAPQEVMSLYPGSTMWGMAHPYFVAISDGMAISVWPIQSGTSAGAVGWGMACANGVCPNLPGNFITASALSQFMNELGMRGWQIFSHSGALLRVPLMIPLYPFEDQLQKLPQG